MFDTGCWARRGDLQPRAAVVRVVVTYEEESQNSVRVLKTTIAASGFTRAGCSLLWHCALRRSHDVASAHRFGCGDARHG